MVARRYEQPQPRIGMPVRLADWARIVLALLDDVSSAAPQPSFATSITHRKLAYPPAFILDPRLIQLVPKAGIARAPERLAARA